MPRETHRRTAKRFRVRGGGGGRLLLNERGVAKPHERAGGTADKVYTAKRSETRREPHMTTFAAKRVGGTDNIKLTNLWVGLPLNLECHLQRPIMRYYVSGRLAGHSHIMSVIGWCFIRLIAELRTPSNVFTCGFRDNR